MDTGGRLLTYVRRTSVVWKMRLLLLAGLVVTNLVGAIVVYCLAALVVPLPAVEDDATLRLHNLVVAALVVPVLVLVGVVRGLRVLGPTARWLREGRAPDEAERRHVLLTPRRMFRTQAALWTVAAVGFAIFNASVRVPLGALVGLIVALAGLSTSSIAYLVAERTMRPLARRALASGVPEGIRIRTVTMRSMLAWTLGTGVSVLGVVLVGITTLGDLGEATVDQLAITMIVLGGIAFVVGAFSAFLAAKASSDPVRALRRALARVAHGDLDTEVPIYDGTEIGVLQAGFNEMVAGLRERDRIRDLFGRHVGDDVARTALESGAQFDGETRQVAVLFVDIIGSTTLAAERPPEEVVGLLNRFFDVVIDVVHEHGGWINKFEGDAALAIWGAPVPMAAMESAALAAARTLGDRLSHDVPELRAGIGVSAGRAVAGNVGAAERYEYTVIGDPVNEAARLTELAKEVPAGVVARASLLEAAGSEADHWESLEPVVVRGRSEPTPVASPRRPEPRD